MSKAQGLIEFVNEIYPDNADAALAFFNEQVVLKDATDLMRKLKTENEQLKAEKEPT